MAVRELKAQIAHQERRLGFLCDDVWNCRELLRVMRAELKRLASKRDLKVTRK